MYLLERIIGKNFEDLLDQHKEAIPFDICNILHRLYKYIPLWIPHVRIVRKGKGEIEIISTWLINLEAVALLNEAEKQECDWVEEERALINEKKPKDPPITEKEIQGTIKNL